MATAEAGDTALGAGGPAARPGTAETRESRRAARLERERAEARRVEELLKRPFPPEKVRFRVGATTGQGAERKGQALAYITARTVEDRLDEVMGIDGWETEFVEAGGGAVQCRLSLWINGRKRTKGDAGAAGGKKGGKGQGGQAGRDGDDPANGAKAAFSDALKRAASQWGVGRYLYEMKSEWLPLDESGQRFAQKPSLKGAAQARPARPRGEAAPRPQAATAEPSGKGRTLPASGAELMQRLADKEQAMAAAGRCKRGELFGAVRKAGRDKYGDNLMGWDDEQAIRLAVQAVKEWEAALPAGTPAAASA